MRIIKTSGISSTNTNGDRIFISRATAKQPEEVTLQVETYVNKYNRVIIGQWISTIDKIIAKPKTDKKTGKSQNPTELQFEVRDNLGAQCWKLLIEKRIFKLSDNSDTKNEEIKILIALWNWRLHPYGANGNYMKEEDAEYCGRWYSTFLQEIDVANINHITLANDIYQHLHVVERRIDGNIKDGKHGLVNARAQSISVNSHSIRLSKLTQSDTPSFDIHGRVPWSKGDERLFVSNGDLAEEIYQTNLEAENSSHERATKKRTLKSKDAGAIIYRHYKEQFEDENKNVPRRTDIEETQKGLIRLYDAVRLYYKTLLRSHRKNTLTEVLPENCGRLFEILKAKKKNSSTGDLIRLGRVLHYHHAENFKQDTIHNDLFGLSNEEVAKSRFWTSDGQAEIKRTETFVRLWRNLVSQGSRSLKNLADPDDNHEGDILSGEFSDRFAKRDFEFPESEEAKFHTSILTLFGESADWFLVKADNGNIDNWHIPPGKLAHLALRTMGTCRNGVFHFTDRVRFTEKLKDKLTKLANNNRPVVEKVSLMFQADKLLRTDRLNKVCQGAGLHLFSKQNELDNYLDLVGDERTSDIILPKFNALLQRLQNNSKLDVALEGTLPGPASHVELTTPLRAKFVGMKIVYEKSFKLWLDSMGKDPLFVKKWIETAVQETENRLEKVKWDDAKLAAIRKAREKNKKNGGSPKDKLPEPTEDQIKCYLDPHHDQFFSKVKAAFEGLAGHVSLDQFLDRLTAETASEMQIQKGYASDPDASSKHGKWINSFRMDVIGSALLDYCAQTQITHKLNWLLQLDGDSRPSQTSSNYPEKPDLGLLEPRTGQEIDWKTLVYFMVHFVPVDDVAQLLHQFRKWKALEEKSTIGSAGDGNADVAELRSILELYQSMHDDKFDGADMGLGLDPFVKMFEREEDFKLLFLDPNNDDDLLAGTRRGLREISRFGHLPVLKHVIQSNIIKQSEVQQLVSYDDKVEFDKKSVTRIARYQLAKKKLHHEMIETPGDATEVNYKNYQICIEQISKHRNLVSQVRFSGLIKTHRLLMSVLARLVDYSAIWERDLYFTTLALLHQKNKQPEDVFKDESRVDENGKRLGKSALAQFVEDGKVDTRDWAIKDTQFKNDLNHCHNPNDRQIRNDFAHFNILDVKRAPVNLTNEINRVRKLLKYDRKLRNAVTKSIIDLMHKEGFEIKWKCQGHQMREPEVQGRKIEHLAKTRKTRLFNLYQEEQAKLSIDKLLPKQTQDIRKQHPEIMEGMHSSSYIMMVKALWRDDFGSENK